MKRLNITILMLIVLASFGFAGGQSESDPAPAAAADEVQTIRIVGKEFTDSDPANVQHLLNIKAGFEDWSGKKIKLELVPMPEGAYAEKLNLMLLGGDIPDLIYFQGGDEVIANQAFLLI